MGTGRKIVEFIKDFRPELDFEKHFVDCIGPKGTLYVHTGNTLHRYYPVYNTERFVWSQIYTMDKVFLLMTKKDKSELPAYTFALQFRQKVFSNTK